MLQKRVMNIWHVLCIVWEAKSSVYSLHLPQNLLDSDECIAYNFSVLASLEFDS